MNMNKLNLPPFYIGQKVVYITGNNMPKDSVHVVSNLMQTKCGCWAILINNMPPDDSYFGKPYYACTVCKNAISGETAGWWTATSFRPVQQAKFPLITLSKIQEVEKEEILIPN